MPLHETHPHALSPHLRESLALDILVGLMDEVRCDAYALTAHGGAVARTARSLALAVGLDEGSAARAYVAGLVHDVGKALTQPEILFKPGPLSDAERAHVRKHPADGERLVRVLASSEVARAVRHHHERIDGKGYPDGLRGEAIPVLARIVSVADYYEALRETRVYRPGFSKDEAIATVERAARERALDASIVCALLEIVA